MRMLSEVERRSLVVRNRRLISARARAARRRIKSRLRDLRKKAKATRKTAVRVRAPEVFVFSGTDDDRLTLNKFFERVRRELERDNRVLIELSAVKKLFPCGMLLFMAELHDWLRIFPGKLSANYPESALVEEMLQHTKVLQSLGLQPRRQIAHEHVVRWHYFEGDEVDLTGTEPLAEKVAADFGAETQLALFSCLNEAITNVRQHAYGENPTCKTSWWMFASMHKKKLYIAVHDRGLSVPKTILSKPGIKDAFALVASKGDQTKLDRKVLRAVIDGRTRTKLSFRGKGIPEMLALTTTAPGSSLTLMSRAAFVVADASKPHKKFGPLQTPVRGTLVLWSLSPSDVDKRS